MVASRPTLLQAVLVLQMVTMYIALILIYENWFTVDPHNKARAWDYPFCSREHKFEGSFYISGLMFCREYNSIMSTALAFVTLFHGPILIANIYIFDSKVVFILGTLALTSAPFINLTQDIWPVWHIIFAGVFFIASFANGAFMQKRIFMARKDRKVMRNFEPNKVELYGGLILIVLAITSVSTYMITFQIFAMNGSQEPKESRDYWLAISSIAEIAAVVFWSTWNVVALYRCYSKFHFTHVFDLEKAHSLRGGIGLDLNSDSDNSFRVETAELGDIQVEETDVERGMEMKKKPLV